MEEKYGIQDRIYRFRVRCARGHWTVRELVFGGLAVSLAFLIRGVVTAFGK